MGLFDIGICVIFCREFFEAGFILTNYNTVIERLKWDDDRKASAKKAMWQAAAASMAVAGVMILILGVSLDAVGKKMDNVVAELVEGISKIVAALCIGQFSLKIPKWLGVYAIKSNKMEEFEKQMEQDLTDRSLFFNVAWNLWREMAEVGVFLLPFFLNGKAEEVPLSALAGVAIAGVLGALIFLANWGLKESTVYLAFWMSFVTALLATGLFAGGCHEFEEVMGETPHAYSYASSCTTQSCEDFWNHKKFPMVVAKVFGYYKSPTYLVIVCWWVFGLTMVGLHYYKLQEGIKKMQEESPTPDVDAEKAQAQAEVQV